MKASFLPEDAWDLAIETLKAHGAAYDKGFDDGFANGLAKQIIKVDGKLYTAKNPTLKTVHKDGEVVLGGFREVEK